MNHKTYQVTVVIPIYKEILPPLELKALKNNLAKLQNYHIVFIAPNSLVLDRFNEQINCECQEVIRVSDEWLGKNGISGYNKMMLSRDFYTLFSDSKYILICHTDSYIFRDELSSWCNLDYDCIAPPWMKRPIYNFPIVWLYMQIRRKLYSRYLHHLKQDVYGRIGNGGLSLRKVDSFIDATEKYKTEIEFYNKSTHHLYHEDVFWALIPKEFTYPDQCEALKFGIESNPKYCYKINNKSIPFGCHGITRKRLFKFWKIHIE